MVRKKIKKAVKKAILELQKKKKLPKFSIPEIQIDFPKQKEYGDYTSNIALLLKTDANKIAQAIKSPYLEKVEVKNNFINFFLSPVYLQKQVLTILKNKEKFSQLNLGKKKKLNLEFISANPTGPLTIGNARGGPFGDTLAKIFKKAGFQVSTTYYINDYGQQILALGHSVLKDEQAVYQGDYLNGLNKKIKGQDPYQVGRRAAQYILEKMIKKTIKRLGIHFDEWVSESQFHQKGEVDKVINLLKKKNLIYQKDNAWWFKSSKFGDQRDRVMIKENGQKTYLAGDLAYHWHKFKKKKYDWVVNIWGADHSGDVSGLQAGLTALGWKNKLTIIILQFVTLFQKQKKLKMSKRAGIYVTLDELLNEVPPEVVRFFFLEKSADTHLNFDLDLAKEQSERNPVYYIQYAYARIYAILRKYKKFKFQNYNFKINSKFKIQNSEIKIKLLNHPSELTLIKQLIRLPEVIEDIARDYQIQRMPQYAMDLAMSFHQFYRDCRVLTENQKLSQARLSLVLATQIILKEVLFLMGINAPEKM